jgi:hypothetical protein
VKRIEQQGHHPFRFALLLSQFPAASFRHLSRQSRSINLRWASGSESM